jgi:hypothetical protein
MLSDDVGSGWKPCPRCRPADIAFSGVTGDSRPRAARRRDPAGQADDVFRQVGVERLLKESRQPGGIRRFRYEANGQECSNWFKLPHDLDPASAKWQMFLLGPGATIHA